MDKNFIISTKYISEKLNMNHRSIKNLIQKHDNIFKELGCLTLSKSSNNKDTGRNTTAYHLNKMQFRFLISIMANLKNIIYLKKELILGNIKLDDFIIKEQVGHVYIVRNKNNLIKIGNSINPKKRLNTLESQIGDKLDIIYISEHKSNYREIEQKLHFRFNAKKHLGEWFYLSKNDINDAIQYIKQL